MDTVSFPSRKVSSKCTGSNLLMSHFEAIVNPHSRDSSCCHLLRLKHVDGAWSCHYPAVACNSSDTHHQLALSNHLKMTPVSVLA